MSKSSFRFSISWPFIIGCYIVYSIFFGSDDDEKKPVDIKTTVTVEQKEIPNKIDETVEKIKREIKESLVIKKAKEEFIKSKDELMKDEEPEVNEPEIVADEIKEEPPVLESEETNKPEEFDGMKPL